MKNLHLVVIVRAKGDGSLMVRINKAAIEKIVAIRVHEYLDLDGSPPAGTVASRATLVDPMHAISHWWEHRQGLPASMLSHSHSSTFSAVQGPTARTPAPPLDVPLSEREISSLAAQDAPYSGDMFSGANFADNDEEQKASAADKALPQPAAGKTIRCSGWSVSEGLPRRSSHSREGPLDSLLPEAASGSVLGVFKTTTEKGKGKDVGKHRKKGSASPPRSYKKEGAAKDGSVMKTLPISESYKPKPGRSKAPGFFGNEAQNSTGKEFAAVAWNDNTDIDRISLEGTVLPGMEPRDQKPVLFKDEKGPDEEKMRSHSPENKEMEATEGTEGIVSRKSLPPL